MSFLQLVLLLDKTIEGINSILPIVSYRNMKHVALLRKAKFRHPWLVEWCKVSFDLMRNMTLTQPPYFVYVFCRYQFTPFGPVAPVPPCVREAETPGFCDRVKT